MYKIRRKQDGLYSTGGTVPRFTKTGKTWSQRHHVSAHITLVLQAKHAPVGVYAGCEVVCFQLEEIAWFSMVEMLRDAQTRRAIKAQQSKAAQVAETERRERAEYDRLRKKFEHGNTT